MSTAMLRSQDPVALCILAASVLALQLAGSGCGGSGGDKPKGGSMETFTPSPTPTVLPIVNLDLKITVEAPINGLTDIFARVDHNGGRPVSFVLGCTGSGRVKGAELAIADEAGRILSDDNEYPCGPALLCPVATEELDVGQSLAIRYVFDGTVWVPDEPVAPRNGCDPLVSPQTPYPRCAQMQLPPGRYTLIARFNYCDSEQTSGMVESRTTFEWP